MRCVVDLGIEEQLASIHGPEAQRSRQVAEKGKKPLTTDHVCRSTNSCLGIVVDLTPYVMRASQMLRQILQVWILEAIVCLRNVFA